jgi:hypothetical protein
MCKSNKISLLCQIYVVILLLPCKNYNPIYDKLAYKMPYCLY